MNDNQPEVAETIGYAAAMAELEEILRDLEGDDLDVDMLASRVERASSLISLCRQRIGAARVQVERVVANLDSEDEALVDAGADGDEGS
ncbi:MAG: exodeoxyribonuclease VII small subunit [Acidimicrobiaceae bacterium]|nr:exodeoxyribonuclease VII small subunit [Acidimicrobiaceae bacterium]